MAHAFSQVWLHVVFSTKHRQPFLDDPKVRAEVHRYLAGICDQLDCKPQIVGGVADHVHILCSQARTMAASELLKNLKRDSSRWIKQQSSDLKKFQWQKGYGVFGVSQSAIGRVEKYIANQEKHHANMSYKREFRAHLRKHKIPYNEDHIWE